MARVLVTEKIAQSGLDLLAEAGHEVDVQEGLIENQRAQLELVSAIIFLPARVLRAI